MRMLYVWEDHFGMNDKVLVLLWILPYNAICQQQYQVWIISKSISDVVVISTEMLV